ncbi:MAG TPA: hypothetical protein VFO83_11575, partial [Aggregicoccus sp.]|nr:hypothetical protein [Aggregicoccus sp.]
PAADFFAAGFFAAAVVFLAAILFESPPHVGAFAARNQDEATCGVSTPEAEKQPSDAFFPLEFTRRTLH